jgi:hypothetical protein
MLDVERCKILIAGNCIFRRGIAGVVRDVVPSALIEDAFCFCRCKSATQSRRILRGTLRDRR